MIEGQTMRADRAKRANRATRTTRATCATCATRATGLHARACVGAALLWLAGCGGGGSSESATTTAPTSPAPTTPTSPTTPGGTATPGTRATCNLANFESELLASVNAYRAAGANCGSSGAFPAAPALAWNAAATQAALVHSDDMVARNFFDHSGSNGSNAGQRLTAAGYVWRGWGENIAAGQSNVAQVMAGWMASPGHCANIMVADFRDIGVACVNGGASNTYRSYWTMNLGTPR